jgi:hypothetical protein
MRRIDTHVFVRGFSSTSGVKRIFDHQMFVLHLLPKTVVAW